MKKIITLISVSIILLSCKKEIIFESVIGEIAELTFNSARFNFITKASSQKTALTGVVISTAPNPDLLSEIVTETSKELEKGENWNFPDVEQFSPNTHYYVRSYVKYNEDIYYSEEKEFTTPDFHCTVTENNISSNLGLFENMSLIKINDYTYKAQNPLNLQLVLTFIFTQGFSPHTNEFSISTTTLPTPGNVNEVIVKYNYDFFSDRIISSSKVYVTAINDKLIINFCDLSNNSTGFTFTGNTNEN